MTGDLTLGPDNLLLYKIDKIGILPRFFSAIILKLIMRLYPQILKTIMINEDIIALELNKAFKNSKLKLQSDSK